MKRWYARIGESESGPYSDDELLAIARCGAYTEKHEFRHEKVTHNHWVLAARLPILRDAIASAPPPPEPAPVPVHKPTPDPVYVPTQQQHHWRCRHCGWVGVPTMRTQISTGGWVVFGFLLVLCFPLFWVGLLIKDLSYECGRCHNRS